jgi:hypothetical protein
MKCKIRTVGLIDVGNEPFQYKSNYFLKHNKEQGTKHIFTNYGKNKISPRG